MAVLGWSMYFKRDGMVNVRIFLLIEVIFKWLDANVFLNLSCFPAARFGLTTWAAQNSIASSAVQCLVPRH